MSRHFSFDVLCERCGNRDQDEEVIVVWGQFVELPPEPWSMGKSRGVIVCARCGGEAGHKPRGHVLDSTPDDDLATRTAYVTIVPLDGAVVVRTYVKGELAAEARLNPRRAVFLAQDALNGAVAVGCRAPGPDQ